MDKTIYSYRYVVSKLIVQFGLATVYESNNRFPMTFPIAFGTFRNVLGTVRHDAYNFSMVSTMANSLTGCTFTEAQSTSPTSYPIQWFAIGT